MAVEVEEFDSKPGITRDTESVKQNFNLSGKLRDSAVITLQNNVQTNIGRSDTFQRNSPVSSLHLEAFFDGRDLYLRHIGNNTTTYEKLDSNEGRVQLSKNALTLIEPLSIVRLSNTAPFLYLIGDNGPVLIPLGLGSDGSTEGVIDLNNPLSMERAIYLSEEAGKEVKKHLEIPLATMQVLVAKVYEKYSKDSSELEKHDELSKAQGFAREGLYDYSNQLVLTTILDWRDQRNKEPGLTILRNAINTIQTFQQRVNAAIPGLTMEEINQANRPMTIEEWTNGFRSKVIDSANFYVTLKKPIAEMKSILEEINIRINDLLQNSTEVNPVEDSQIQEVINRYNTAIDNLRKIYLIKPNNTEA